MTLSYRECHIASALDEELAADPRLRAVVDLFAEPPPCRAGWMPDRPRRSRTADAPSPGARPTSGIVLSVVVTLLGLLCCALTAALRLPAVASAGAVLATCAATAFAVAFIHRRTRATVRTAAGPEPSTTPTVGSTNREGKEIPT